MKYSEKFKREVVETFKHSKDLPRIVRAIENGDHDTVRIVLENSIDDITLYDVNKVNKNGKLKVHRLKKDTYNERKELYDSFMAKYDDYLNSQVSITGNKLIHD